MTLIALDYTAKKYTCLSTDITNSRVNGVVNPGCLIYVKDVSTNQWSWYIVQSDLTLAVYNGTPTTVQDSLGGQLRISGDGQAWVRARESAMEASGEIFLLANPSDGETITIGDGVHTATVFEFDSNESVTGDNISVLIGATPAATVATLVPLINNATDLNITATYGGTGTTYCTLVNDFTGSAGNVAITTTSANVTLTGMSGGLDEVSLRTLQEDVFTVPNLTADAKNLQLTMSTGVGSCPIPHTAKMIGVKPASTVMRCGFVAPEAAGTATGTASAADFKLGAIITSTDWTWFKVVPNGDRILYFAGGTSDVVYVVYM